MKQYDVVIVGGGPAGSTVASLVKRYSPHLRVLLLEKAHFPRHHVGESLLAGATPVVLEMGAYEKIKQHGFVEKLGATYIWGQNRKPWGFEFDEIVRKFAERGQTLPEVYYKAWQVRRAEYDDILLKHAAEMGAEVHEGARVTQVLRSDDGKRVTGAEYQDEHGTHRVASTWLMDCSGQDALLGRQLQLRDYDEHMNNFALFAYWKGAKWKFEYLGHPHITRIFVVTTPRGWIWYIPVSQDVVSVGFVTHRQTLKHMADGPEQLYREEIAACAEIQDLLKDAQLVRIAPDQKRMVCSIQDWSYTSRQMSGPGWAMAGDAAGFVDPILSSGVMLAHELGQKAAYTLNSMFASSSDEQIASYWKFYDDTYHTYLQAYRDMASFWYRNNFSMSSWWWQAQRSMTERNEQINLTDREAFTRVAFGYATRAESLSLFGSFQLKEAQKLVNALFGVIPDTTAIAAKYTQRPLKLKPGIQLMDGMYYYQGQVCSTQRVVSSDQHYIDLHPGEELLINLLDGSHTVEDLDRSIHEIRTMGMPVPVRDGLDLVVQLENIGALV